MGNPRWIIIRTSLAIMVLSALTMAVAEPSGAGMGDGGLGAMEAQSTRCVEDDFVTVAESAGPERAATGGTLVDAARDGHVASTAAIVRIAGAGARERVLGVLKGVMERQQGARGLIGAELGTSEKCGSVRLLSVWQDEGSMLDFTASSDFMAAMAEAESGSGTGVMTAWKLADARPPVGWDAAREKSADANPLF